MRFRAQLDPLTPYRPPPLTSREGRRTGEGEDGYYYYSSSSYANLASNELSFGPLPEVQAAIAEALPRANRYPDRYASSLREEIAAANPGANPAKNVLVGNGSSEVLMNLLQLVERPGEVIFPWPSFGLYVTLGITLGLETTRIPLGKHHEVEREALLSSLTEKTRALILSNPNNPTGTYLTLEEVRALADALPEEALLILDEAYGEFVADPAYHGSHELALERENVVCVRTFSKAHGLAGLRAGYAVAHQRVADYAERVRFPFSVNLAAQVAATASMGAREKIGARAQFVIRERERVQEAFGAAGLTYIPSHGNFVLVESRPEVFGEAGVLVREGESLGYPGWSRVTIGSRAENDRVIGALP